MIKNIVFDMGNVIIRYDVKNYVAPFAETPQDATLLLHELFGSVEWLQMDRGILTPEDAVEIVCARMPEHLHHAVRELVLNWHDDIPPFPEMDNLVRRLKEAGYGIYLLSNTTIKFHDFKKNIPIIPYFDGLFISADCHILKPDPAIYHAFCKEFGLDMGSCFFIDDSTANIESALHQGMSGFIFRGEVPALEQALRKSGVAI